MGRDGEAPLLLTSPEMEAVARAEALLQSDRRFADEYPWFMQAICKLRGVEPAPGMNYDRMRGFRLPQIAWPPR